MCKRGVEPTVATFGTLICIASEAQQSRRVIEAWGWLRASGLEVHVTCANAHLQALIKEVGWGGALLRGVAHEAGQVVRWVSPFDNRQGR